MRNSSSGGSNRLFTTFFYNNTVDATARFYHQTTLNTIDRTSSETNLYSTGNWVHICAAYDTNGGTTPQVYVNGVAATMPSIASGFAVFPWTTIDLWINGYSDGSNTQNIEVAQLWIDNSYVDLSTNLQKFYDTANNQAVDMGSDGTGSGLAQPMIYHNGNASSFGTNSGSLSYSLSVSGSITSTTGPAKSQPAAARTQVVLTAVNNAQVDTAISKFGGASLIVDGTDDYLQAAKSVGHI
jgi:hypothetical protein